MMIDGIDEDTVLEAFREGRLPVRQPDRQWGGSGSGAHCSICGRGIAKSTLEYELEFDGDDHAAGRHHVHIGCFTAWERLVLSRALPAVVRAPKVGTLLEPLHLSTDDRQVNIPSREHAASNRSWLERLECESARNARGPALPGRQRGPAGGGGMG